MNPGSLVPVSEFLTTVLCGIHSAVLPKVIIESLTLGVTTAMWVGLVAPLLTNNRHYVHVLPSPRHTHPRSLPACVSGTSYIHLGRERESNLYWDITLSQDQNYESLGDVVS